MTTHVRVGMPVRNGGDLLPRALDSLLNQTYTDFSIWVSDNGSTDDTPEILREYAERDDRVHVERISPGSAESNFARLLWSADGDAFMWAAHDDLWLPDFMTFGVASLVNGHEFASANWWVGAISSGVGSAAATHPLGFIEDTDPGERMLRFVNLHHLSHKCNIVYALFDRQFLQNVYRRRDISNDGNLGALICHEGRGKTTDDVLFLKDFPVGTTRSRIRIMAGAVRQRMRRRSESGESHLAPAQFERSKAEGLANLLELFPAHSSELRSIFEKYSAEHSGQPDWRIDDSRG